MPFDWCVSPDIGLPAPDLVLFFDVSPEVARTRGGYGEERYEKEEMQRRVREAFSRIETLEDDDDVKTGRKRWAKIDASKSVEEVGEEAWKLVESFWESNIDAEVGRLWSNLSTRNS